MLIHDDLKMDQIVKPLDTIVGSVNSVMAATSKLQLPNFNEAKEKAATAAQKEMEGIESKIKSLNPPPKLGFNGLSPGLVRK